MALHCDQLICSSAVVPRNVRLEFIKRFVTDAAGAAVFEKKHGTLAGLGNGGLEFHEVR